MAGAPYDKLRRDEDGLYFDARIPALAHLGERYEEMTDASLRELMSPGDPSDETSVNDANLKDVIDNAMGRVQGMYDSKLQELEKQLETASGAERKTLQAQLDMFRKMGGMMGNLGAFSPPNFDDEELSDDNDGDDSESDLPAGTFKFHCGQQKAISPAQIALFNQIVDGQKGLATQIEDAFRSMYDMMEDDDPMPMLPGDEDGADTALHCFQIDEIQLDGKNGRTIINLDSQFGHYDEHGCFILIRDGKVESFGEWDTVFGDEEYEDEDDDEDDDGGDFDDDFDDDDEE